MKPKRLLCHSARKRSGSILQLPDPHGAAAAAAAAANDDDDTYRSYRMLSVLSSEVKSQLTH